MNKLFATTALLTSVFAFSGFVGASQAFATASTTHEGQLTQDQINLQQAQAKAKADKKVADSKDEVQGDKGAVDADEDKLQKDEQKDLADAKANGATIGSLVNQEAKQVGDQDRKKAKSVALIDQQLAQKSAQGAHPAASYCVKLGGHPHMGKGITGKKMEYCYLPNNVRVVAKDVYQAALKGKGDIQPTKSVTHHTKEQKQDLTDENQILKRDAAEQQRYAQQKAGK